MYLLVYFNLPSIFGIFKTGFNGLHTLTSLKSCKPKIIENESIMMLIQGSERLKIKNWLNLDKQLIRLIKVFICLDIIAFIKRWFHAKRSTFLFELEIPNRHVKIFHAQKFEIPATNISFCKAY